MNSVIKFQKSSIFAKIPVRATKESAGMDLYSSEHKVIEPLERKLINTGIKMELLMENCYARIAPTSGFSLYEGAIIGAGVVDQDYRGEIKVLIFNVSNLPITIEIGQKIAQLIVEQIYYPTIVETKDLESNTFRGENGFGSGVLEN